MSKKTFAFIILVVLAAIGGLYYWFFIRSVSLSINTSISQNNGSAIFPSTGGSPTSGKKNTTASGGSNGSTSSALGNVPILRELSTTPVGGMSASTTGSTTIIRWIDRGVGRVYQAYSNSSMIDELSNTTIPRIYETYWNKNATSFILRSLNENSNNITSFFATLYPTAGAASTSNSIATSTPFELRGSPLPSATIALAVSPTGDRVFTLENSSINTDSTGYIVQFNGTKKTQIFTTPLSALNVEWPASNTIALTTKGSNQAAGFLYFVDLKTGILNKILGNVRGLSALVSKDASKVLYTAATANGIKTSIYTIKTASDQDIPFNTMPEKCVWSTLQKNILYCAVPSQIPSGLYPDDWYKGSLSFSDSIWEINTDTGETHIVADLLTASNSIIDATNLVLDPNENYLYFINKNNLTLWSLELNS